MKSWIVSETSSEIAVESNWALSTVNVNVRWEQKIEKIFEVWCIQCNRDYSTSLASNHLLSNNLSISVRIRKQKNKKIRKNSTQISLFTSQLSIIKFRIASCTKSSSDIESSRADESSNHAFSELLTKMFSQIFNADWLKIEKNEIRCEDHDDSASSSQHIRCGDRDHSDSSNLKNQA